MIDAETLTGLLRITGVGFLALALVHLPIARKLGWKNDVSKLSPPNAAIFHIHVFFICLGIVILGVMLLAGAPAMAERSVLGRWVAGGLLVFWTTRLVWQWAGFPWSLWRGKPFETLIQFSFTAVWAAVVVVFALLFSWQMKWIG